MYCHSLLYHLCQSANNFLDMPVKKGFFYAQTVCDVSFGFKRKYDMHDTYLKNKAEQMLSRNYTKQICPVPGELGNVIIKWF